MHNLNELKDRLSAGLKMADCGQANKMAEVGQARMASRMTTRELLLSRAESKRAEAHRMEVLARSLPEIPSESDDLLFHIVLASNHP